MRVEGDARVEWAAELRVHDDVVDDEECVVGGLFVEGAVADDACWLFRDYSWSGADVLVGDVGCAKNMPVARNVWAGGCECVCEVVVEEVDVDVAVEVGEGCFPFDGCGVSHVHDGLVGGLAEWDPVWWEGSVWEWGGVVVHWWCVTFVWFLGG